MGCRTLCARRGPSGAVRAVSYSSSRLYPPSPADRLRIPSVVGSAAGPAVSLVRARALTLTGMSAARPAGGPSHPGTVSHRSSVGRSQRHAFAGTVTKGQSSKRATTSGTCAVFYGWKPGGGTGVVGDDGPGAHGRRSRRGFYFQDVCALRSCLDMAGRRWDRVVIESFEDIVCESATRLLYRQVKTDESPDQLHSPATLCRPKRSGQVKTSILGRLLLDKPLPDHALLQLVLNEQVNAALQPLVTDGARGHMRGAEGVKADIAARLAEITPADGRTPEWCVDRLSICVESRTTEDLENATRITLGPLIKGYLRESPLVDELEDVLIALLWEVSVEARGRNPLPFTCASFEQLFSEVVDRVVGRAFRQSQDHNKLREKLEVAELSPVEIDHAVEMSLKFSRQVRAAVGETRSNLDALSDAVFMCCQEVSARRRAGEVQPGPGAYAAVMTAVKSMWHRGDFARTDLRLSDAWRALAFITGRCRKGKLPGIEGRTKLAKLDFFLRYPIFLQRVQRELARRGLPGANYVADSEVEAPMIRYRFGPWDPRYRQFLSFLFARQLIRITRSGAEKVSLTARGRNLAKELETLHAFRPIVDRCEVMSGTLATMSGSALKDLVYELFPEEVGGLPMGREIQ